MAPASRPPIHVRGYAGDTAVIDMAVTDPFNGHNQGSTPIRIGPDDNPCFYEFESLLLRLHMDERSRVLVDGGQEFYVSIPCTIPPAGICRLIQKIPPDVGCDPAEHVSKLFTYATPHGGIAFDVGFGVLEKLRYITGINGADIFEPQRMYEYLTPKSLAGPVGPPGNWDARAMPQNRPPAFPLDRVFCLIVTDPTDYDGVRGLSAATVGPRSDGLVQIDNARVPGAYQASVHRSHSGDRRVETALVSSAQWSPIELQNGETSVPFVTTFLSSCLGPDDAGAMRYAPHLRILSLQRRDTLLSFTDHLEQAADTDPVGAPALSATWNSAITGSISTYRPDLRALDDENPLRGSGSATPNCPSPPPRSSGASGSW